MSDNTVKTYVIFQGGYEGIDPDVYEFKGTFRQLLVEVGGYAEDHVKGMSDESLLAMVEQCNGDGGPYSIVWCSEDKKKVLG